MKPLTCQNCGKPCDKNTAYHVAETDFYLCDACVTKWEERYMNSVCAKCEKPLKECRCQ